MRWARLGQLQDLLLVLVGQHARGQEFLPPLDVVGLDHRTEDREARLAVEAAVVIGGVDPGDLDLFAGPRHIDEVPEEDHLLVPRQPAGRHRAGRLLQRDLLVVAVLGLLGVQLVRTLGVARRALHARHLRLGPVDGERAQHIPAAEAVVLANLELREHLGAARHHARDFDEAAHVHLPRIPQERVSPACGGGGACTWPCASPAPPTRRVGCAMLHRRKAVSAQRRPLAALTLPPNA